MNTNGNIPTIFVIFGATGDLMQRKIVPALYRLFLEKKLPARFAVVGAARRDLSRAEFRLHIKEILNGYQGKSAKSTGDFLKFFSYSQVEFDTCEDYENLAQNLQKIDATWGLCANKLFYLAVPPEHYEAIAQHLRASHLTDPCSPEEGWTPLEINRLQLEKSFKTVKPKEISRGTESDESLTGWTRVIVEKPFGRDFKTAERLEEVFGRLFKEVQIYRIDHYMGKEMIQNILTFRFSNHLFERTWDNQSIESIHIRLNETQGVETRGALYDGLGALRDVGQNHLLQMLAFTTMEHPITFAADPIRKKRAALLGTLKAPSIADIRAKTFRAQYAGYRKIPAVDKKSQTETYFKIIAELDHPDWRGVPIVMESGKRMEKREKDILVTFKHPLPCLCPPGGEHHRNTVRFMLEPEERISIEFWSKKPGFTFQTERRTLDFLLRDPAQKTQYTEEYTKLLWDCIAGDQTLFLSTDEVRAMWRFIDPIVLAWRENAVPLSFYKPDTAEAIEAADRIGSESGKVSARGGSASGGKVKAMRKEIAVIGLGKMGGNIARRLKNKGWEVTGYDAEKAQREKLKEESIAVVKSLSDLAAKMHASPRIFWLMIPAFVKATAGRPAGKPLDEVLFGKNGLAAILKKGDIVIDGGNSFYKDSVARYKKLKKMGIDFMDVGVSGGPAGALTGSALMIGGERKVFQRVELLFADLARPNGCEFFEGAGAGHFVKMIHNGIEYGMMQAIAEGFAVLKNSKYDLDLIKIADVYQNGSVIESRLVGWLKNALEFHGEDLEAVSGAVGHTGEGEWTVKTAEELKVKVKVIEEALKFRVESLKNPSYTGKILSALRGEFGGHSVKS